MKRLLLAGTAIAAGATAAVVLFTPWQRRWGATDEELARQMPGDDIVPDADMLSTRAVTVHARPGNVWPWLAQMGNGRGGLYSYDALDILFGILDKPSSRVILPEFQDLHAGDVIPIRKGGNFYVHVATPNECLVIGPEDQSVPVSWATVLYPEGNTTRLVTRVRVRAAGMPGGRISASWIDFTAFVMVRRWLLNLKERAEGLARARPALREVPG